ncbi:hypothetical protein BDP27DRAFT_1451804 [Rhodocollybia butyracea]|uniref:Uncharacterized protein n=1 Tax=Rhodocollybia butyracea TaxID=206335 RepID=A0A9P5PEF4_9AGAR|nr:hypothetical protein BDP27DRAFT_1451804 [Rhodocollybia butyracea]
MTVINNTAVNGTVGDMAGDVSLVQEVGSLKLQSGPFYIFAIAGILSDAMMIHRCYHLWNSRKSVIILPSLLLIGICITWIVLEALAMKGVPKKLDDFHTSSGEPSNLAAALPTANLTALFTSRVYGSAALVENIILTVLMAGRVWWLERRMRNILNVDKNKTQVSQSLLSPILQSGALNLIFLSICVGAYEPSQFSVPFLTPSALTQVLGISSTLIVLSIGIGLAPDSRSRMADEEKQTISMAPDYLGEAHPTTRFSPQDAPSLNTDTIQPFGLKYDYDALTEPLRPEHS